MEKSKTEKIMKTIKVLVVTLLALLGAAAVGFVLLCITFFYYPYKETAAAISSDGRYTLTVEQTDGRWPFGPSDARIIAEEEGFSCSGSNKETLHETQIWDDGGKGRVTVEWLSEDEVYVTLCGCEQEDERLTIDMTEVFGE